MRAIFSYLNLVLMVKIMRPTARGLGRLWRRIAAALVGIRFLLPAILISLTLAASILGAAAIMTYYSASQVCIRAYEARGLPSQMAAIACTARR